MSKRQRTCDCGDTFTPTYAAQELCPACCDAVEHDANVEMFGEEDAAYFEAAGLDHQIGNQ